VRIRREPRRRQWTSVLIPVLLIAAFVGGQPSTPASGQAEPDPLKCVLHLRIDDPAKPSRRNLRLDQPKALPLKVGDRFRIEARLNRSAHVYLFWIGSEGKISPIYPWKPGHWDARPEREEKIARLDLPERADKAWEIPTGSPGIETLLLLVREESPLPRRDEEKLAKLLSDTHASSSVMIKEAVWLENGREIRLDSQDRALPSIKSRKSDDPVLQIRRLLSEKVQPLGDYWQAVVFPNEGGK
jgi:Domain of unknown function (DUF4384)